jgi:hypothetical protein
LNLFAWMSPLGPELRLAAHEANLCLKDERLGAECKGFGPQVNRCFTSFPSPLDDVGRRVHYPTIVGLGLNYSFYDD